jgi:glycosyltransferase involved in cell wall biosynthesis
MKIFQIITLSELGGAQSVVLELADAMAAAGHEVWVVAGGDGAMWNALNDRVHRVKIGALRRGVSPLDALVWLRLLWLGLRHRPDVVHLHSSKIGALGRLAFRRRKIVYTVHGFDSIRVAWRRFLPLEKALKNRARVIVAVSEYDRRNLAEEGIDGNVVTIYNGIAPVKKSDRTKNWPVERGKKTVLTIARTDPPKRYDLFERIARALPRHNFVWIGNRTAPLNPPANLFALGEIPDAARFYSDADLCVLPSDFEGLPMTIIEAMSAGLPVVASRVGGISEIVRNDENGYTVVNTVSAFAERIDQILSHPDTARQMGLASKAIFEAELNSAKMVEKYLNLYQS